jgi:hypothetical protein
VKPFVWISLLFISPLLVALSWQWYMYLSVRAMLFLSLLQI